MKKISEYGFLSADTLKALRESVEKYIEKGWEPLGGMVFLGYTREIPNNNGGFGLSAVARNIQNVEYPFVQTMVLYKEEKDTDNENQNELCE